MATGELTIPVPGENTMRHHQVVFIKGGEITDYTLMAVFTEHTEKPGAQTTDKKYTVNKTGTKNVTSYDWSMGYTGDMIKSDDVIDDFVHTGRTLAVGSDCKRTICMVDLDEAGASSGTYYAREMAVVNAVDEFSDNDGEMQVKGTLHAASDITEGTFNITTKAFTASAD